MQDAAASVNFLRMTAPTIGCPNCGNQITADRRHSHMAVCDSCRSVVTFGERAAQVAGTMSVLPPPRSKLYVGAMGKFHGKNFSVLGRVRYGYARGYWDEWYLMTDTGEPGWLSEDERHITFETEVPTDHSFQGLSVGQSAEVPGKGSYQVVEKDIATVEGGEGELPFVVIGGQQIKFLDLQGPSGESATWEMDEHGNARMYAGRPVHGGELELDWTRQDLGMDDSLPIARKAGEGGRERVQALEGVRALKCNNCGAGMEVDTKDGVPAGVQCPYCGTKKSLKPRSENCPHCQTPIPLRSGDDAASAVCNGCGSVSQVSPEGLKVLQVASAKETKPYYDPPLKIGQTFTWDGKRYQTVAWVVYEDDEGYPYEEQLLFSDEGGYLWLSFYNNHCTIGARIFDGPRFAQAEDMPEKLLFRGRKFRKTEVATSRVTHVVGELPWICQIGDRTKYAEAACEPYRLAGEWSQTENEWFLGKYVGRKELQKCTEGHINLGPVKGVVPHQPYPASRSQSFWVWMLALLLSVGGIFLSNRPGEPVASFRMGDAAYRSDGGSAGSSFEANGGQILEIQLASPKLNQGWVYIQGTLAKASGGAAVHQFAVQLARFDTGDASENNEEQSVSLKIPEDGSYRLILRAQGDRVVYTKANQNTGYRPAVRVDVVKGTLTPMYFIIFAIFSGLIWFYLLIDRAGFSARKNTEEEDDDEDAAWFATMDDGHDDWDDPW